MNSSGTEIGHQPVHAKISYGDALHLGDAVAWASESVPSRGTVYNEVAVLWNGSLAALRADVLLYVTIRREEDDYVALLPEVGIEVVDVSRDAALEQLKATLLDLHDAYGHDEHPQTPDAEKLTATLVSWFA